MQIKLLFLGQCIANGVGIRAERSYPLLLQQQLRVHYPGVDFPLVVQPFRHPQGMLPLLKVMLRSAPNIVFLSLPGMFASIRSNENLIAHHAPELIPVARAFLKKLEARCRQDSRFGRLLATRYRWTPMKTFAPLSLDAYEQTVREAVLYLQQHSRARAVLMGPGGFNDYSRDGLQTSPKMASELNHKFGCLATELQVAYVNAHELMATQNSDVFLIETHRWSEQGHALVAREIESVIARELTKLPTAHRLLGIHANSGFQLNK